MFQRKKNVNLGLNESVCREVRERDRTFRMGLKAPYLTRKANDLLASPKSKKKKGRENQRELKKFWEELIAYFPLLRHRPHSKRRHRNSSLPRKYVYRAVA
jgi:hypothetical protein